MHKRFLLFVAVAPFACLYSANALAQAGATRTGVAAFGDWRDDAPGVRRKITAGELPAPGASRAAASPSRVVEAAQGALPKAPDGFVVERIAAGLSEPRVLRVAPNGDLFIAETGAGRIRVLRENGRLETFASGLAGVFGLAFTAGESQPGYLYAATPTRVVRFAYRAGDVKSASPPQTIIEGIPGGGHSTRDLALSKDGKKLFVSVGSASNVAEGMQRLDAAALQAHEAKNGIGAAWGAETGRASVLAFDADGGNRRPYATGLRNCAGLTLDKAGEVWCVVNERDMLGDDLPPDYATRVTEAGFYGWPWQYIGSHQDPRHKDERRDLAAKVIVPDVLFQAHSAPLGIAFHDGAGLPPAWGETAFVTLHGSWNRSRRTGYKVVRLIFRDGKPTGEYEDFLTGFVVDDNSVWGRPVGVAVAKDGSVLVSEDGNGTLWRVRAVR